MPKFVKGSPEAKEWGQNMRAAREGKGLYASAKGTGLYDSGASSGDGLGLGLYSSGSGIVHHHHVHETIVDGQGIMHIHHHHDISGGHLSKIGQAFNKAFNPSKNGLDKALPVIEKDAKVVGHYAIPALTGALGGAAGSLAGPAGAVVGSPAGSYTGTQIDKALGIQNNTSFDGSGIKKRKARQSK